RPRARPARARGGAEVPLRADLQRLLRLRALLAARTSAAPAKVRAAFGDRDLARQRGPFPLRQERIAFPISLRRRSRLHEHRARTTCVEAPNGAAGVMVEKGLIVAEVA